MKPLSRRPVVVWLFFVLVVGGAGAGMAWNHVAAQTRVVNEDVILVRTAAWVVEKSITNQLVAASNVLDTAKAGGYKHPEDFAQLGTSLAGVRTIYATDAAGIVTASSQSELLGSSVASITTFRQAQADDAHRGLILGEPVPSVLGVGTLSAAKRLETTSGKFAGVVAISLDPDFYKSLLDSVRDGPQVWARLYHGADYLYMDLTEGSTLLADRHADSLSDYASFRKLDVSSWVLQDPRPSPPALPRVAAFRLIDPAGLFMDHPLVVEVGEDLRASLAQVGQSEFVDWLLFALTVVLLALAVGVFQWRQSRYSEETRQFSVLIQETSARFQLATEAARLGVWEWNPATNDLEWDAAMRQLYGLDPAAPQPDMPAWTSAILEEDRAKADRALQFCVTSHEPAHRLFRIRRPDGAIRWIQCNARFYMGDGQTPSRVIGINEDITGRVTSASALIESERFLKSVTDKIPTKIAYFDLQQICRFANPGYAESHFLKPQSMVGQSMADLLGPELYQARLPLVEQAVNGVANELQVPHTNSEGKTEHLWIHYLPDLHQGLSRGFFVLVDDLSELKEAQSQLEAQQGRLLLNARMAQMGELLSLIAHQWRQPLTVISALVGNVQLKSQLGSLDSEYLVSKLEKISQTVVSLSNTIESFRAFYAPAKNRSLADLGELTAQAIELLSPLLKTQALEVRFEHPAEPILAVVFRAEVMQVIIELLGNARTALSGRTGWVSVRWTEAGTSVVLEVANNGGSIRAEDLPRLFQPYFTTKTDGSGTGMGLYMAKVIIESHHGGSIEAFSEGDVATFRITLPREAPTS